MVLRCSYNKAETTTKWYDISKPDRKVKEGQTKDEMANAIKESLKYYKLSDSEGMGNNPE